MLANHFSDCQILHIDLNFEINIIRRIRYILSQQTGLNDKIGMSFVINFRECSSIYFRECGFGAKREHR